MANRLVTTCAQSAGGVESRSRYPSWLPIRYASVGRNARQKAVRFPRRRHMELARRVLNRAASPPRLGRAWMSSTGNDRSVADNSSKRTNR